MKWHWNQLLCYNQGLDRIEGFEDIGELGTFQFVADHALAFIVRGLYTQSGNNLLATYLQLVQLNQRHFKL